MQHMTTAYESGNVPPIEIRHRLRIAREFAGLEQRELADLIGVSRNTIGNAETGGVKPRRITLNAWALACGVPVSWILNGDGPAGKPPMHPGPGPSKGPDGTPPPRPSTDLRI
ncbi:hypothetical protein A9W94_00590, partial [Mycobacterium asiaticum]